MGDGAVAKLDDVFCFRGAEGDVVRDENTGTVDTEFAYRSQNWGAKMRRAVFNLPVRPFSKINRPT